MKPIIGINLDFDLLSEVSSDFNLEPKLRSFIYPEYYDAVTQVGGIPLLIPPLKKKIDMKYTLKKVDGLILSGGDDINPKHFRKRRHPKTEKMVLQRRGDFDIEFAKIALSINLPILAICYGMQVLNVARGGTIIQDIPSILKSKTIHKRKSGNVFHNIKIEQGSRLFDTIKKQTIAVNSSHHQAIDRLGKRIKPVAFAPDRVIEAIELSDKRFVLGIQWHPEKLFDKSEHLAIFKALINYAKKGKCS